MYNYHANAILIIDATLLGASIFLAIVILLYILMKEHNDTIRDNKLVEIKKGLYKFFQSGKSGTACFNLAAKATVQQFLDIEGNRRRDAVFFNQTEQALFKKCFVTADSMKLVERTARSSRNKWRRIEAIIALGYCEKESAISILRKALKSKDTDIVYFSVIALGQLKTNSSAELLLGLLKRDPFMRRKVVSILETFPDSLAEGVLKLVDEGDPSLRVWAVKLLSKLKPAQYRKRIETLTRDPSDEMRAAACECLGSIGSKDSESALVKALTDEAWFVRMYAVRALAKILGEKSIPLIMKMVNDGSLYVLDSVKTALKDNIRASLPYIEKILQEGDGFAKSMCLEALDSSGYLQTLLKDLFSEDKNTRDAANRIFKSILTLQTYFGIESAMKTLDLSLQKKVLDLIRSVDSMIADNIEKRLSGGAGI